MRDWFPIEFWLISRAKPSHHHLLQPRNSIWPKLMRSWKKTIHYTTALDCPGKIHHQSRLEKRQCRHVCTCWELFFEGRKVPPPMSKAFCRLKGHYCLQFFSKCCVQAIRSFSHLWLAKNGQSQGQSLLAIYHQWLVLSSTFLKDATYAYKVCPIFRFLAPLLQQLPPLVCPVHLSHFSVGKGGKNSVASVFTFGCLQILNVNRFEIWSQAG